jgi:prophage regulatory protein
MENKYHRSTSFLRLPQIIGNPKANPPVPPLIPIKKSTLWAWVKAKQFPPPLKIGNRVTVWRSEDVFDFIKNGGFKGVNK